MAGSAGSTVTALPAAAPTAASVTEEEVASMHQFIENALDLLLKGNGKSYHFLVQQLSAAPTAPTAASATTRCKIFRALPRCISSMAREPTAYRALLDVLFKFDFLAGDAAEGEDYARFVVHLISSNTVYVVPALQMLVRNLCRPQPHQLPPALQTRLRKAAAQTQAQTAETKSNGIKIGGSFGVPAASTPAPAPAVETETLESVQQAVEQRVQQRFDTVHATLERVLALVPTAANVLFPVLCEHFPHKRLDAATQVAYLRNVLRVTDYVPGLRERVLALVIDQLVAIDVEIKLDESEEDVFTMDDFLDDDLLPPDDASRQVDEMADKLDQMMLVMFEHIEQASGPSGAAAGAVDASDGDSTTLDMRQAALIFKFLLKVFEHSILNTHRSKYPQFLLFYVCRLDPQFQDVFISQLLATSLDPQTPPTTRQSCGAYLASFLARAKYISVAYLQKALYHLLKWLHDQMDVYDAALQQEQDRNDARQLESESESEARVLEEAEATLESSQARGFQEGIFISTLQTVCYLVCFRGLEIAGHDNGAGYDFLRSLGWERLLVTSSGYCPLAFCQQTVATEFLNLVETFDLVSEACLDQVDQAIGSSTGGDKGGKSMERSTTPTAASASAATLLGQRQPLETFFPFDPYLLRRSFRFIGPLYIYWKHADPTSSENGAALNAVKATIRQLQLEAEAERVDSDDDSDDSDSDAADEDVSMAGSAPASYRADSYMGSLGRSHRASVGSSYDGEGLGFGEDEDGSNALARARRALPSRSTFDPSPALSASSPPSRLPPLGASEAFTLGGFDDEDEDNGF